MRVTMTETRNGSPDGITVQTYEAGTAHNLPDDLANVFLSEGWAVCDFADGEPGPAESKVVAPEETPEQPRRGRRAGR